MSMHTQDAIQSAFQQLKSAFENKTPIAPLRTILGDTDIDAAYAVQELLIDYFVEQGARPVGVKIGLTSFAVQQQLGVDQPDFGVLFAHTHIPNKGSIPASFLMQPKAEAEMAFVLKAGISDTLSSVQELLTKIDYVTAAVELVGSRIANWDIRITDTVADNASASHFILGETRVMPDQVDFEGAAMQLRCNGVLVSEGTAKACMGNPLNAVLWLCNTFVARGVCLSPGDIILSGALGPMVPCKAGDVFEASIDGLGDVSFSITD